MTQLDNKTDTALMLPRPLVNKILTHAQQNSTPENLAGENHISSCGLVSLGTHSHKYYYPLALAPASSNTTTCFSHNNPAFQQLVLQIQAQRQTLLAYVFTASQTAGIALIKAHLVTLNRCYYIMNSLDIKGVLTMQGYVRDKTGLKKIKLSLEGD